MDDSDYLRLLTHQAEQANAFLSNARKWERERWVCQRLLQALNVSHRLEEFSAAEHEPPDVLFREASFEVFFVLDEGRRLNDEWRAELERRRSAFSLSQLVRREAKPTTHRRSRSATAPDADLAQESAQLHRSAASTWASWTLLAYVNLKRAVPDFNSHFPATHRVSSPRLALTVTGRAHLCTRTVCPSGCARLSAQQPWPHGAV